MPSPPTENTLLPHTRNEIGAVCHYRTHYGSTSIAHSNFYQDVAGGRRILSNGWVANRTKNNVVVDYDKPRPNGQGFACVAWNPDIKYGTTVEIRIYYVAEDGGIWERCYSANGGPDAVWYDGSLQGQFKAAPYSHIAANASSNKDCRVYYQEAETNRIVELYRPGGYTFDPFHIESVREEGLEGTRIAVDSNNVTHDAQPELIYQKPDGSWSFQGAVDGAAPFNSPFQYLSEPPAPVAASGGTRLDGGMYIFTVNADGNLVVSWYDKDKNEWQHAETLKSNTTDGLWASSCYEGYGKIVNVYFKKDGRVTRDTTARLGFTTGVIYTEQYPLPN